MNKFPRRDDRVVSASELAQMGACEKRIYFERKYGRRTTHEQLAATERGNRAHDSFFKEAMRARPAVKTSLEKPWCLIATFAFGPTAVETQILRSFRDQVLRKHSWGRAAVRRYYQVSPRFCRWLEGRRWAVLLTRGVLRPVVLMVRLLLASSEKGSGGNR